MDLFRTYRKQYLVQYPPLRLSYLRLDRCWVSLFALHRRLIPFSRWTRHHPAPLAIFAASPILHPTIKTESAKDKQKEADLDTLACHPSASLGRRAGDLIAFFESGAAVGTSRPASPTKSDGSFVSAESAAGGAGVVAGPRSSSGSSLYGQPMSPGKLSASTLTFTRTLTGA
jgi:hypothetical protein